VENVAAFKDADQTRLHMWLDHPTRRAQVVSTAAYPLFPLNAVQFVMGQP
jgi:hypothetical protein